MSRLHVTFKGTDYDITIDGDNVDEIKTEYEKIKHALTHGGPISAFPDRSRKTATVQPTKSPQQHFRGLLNQRVMELVTENFFKTEQEGSAVDAELGRRGYHHDRDAVRMALLTFVRKKVLRRIESADKEKRGQYAYVNP
jgi:hypothetical protein